MKVYAGGADELSLIMKLVVRCAYCSANILSVMSVYSTQSAYYEL